MSAVLPVDSLPAPAGGRWRPAARARRGLVLGKHRVIVIAVARFLLVALGVLVLIGAQLLCELPLQKETDLSPERT